MTASIELIDDEFDLDYKLDVPLKKKSKKAPCKNPELAKFKLRQRLYKERSLLRAEEYQERQLERERQQQEEQRKRDEEWMKQLEEWKKKDEEKMEEVYKRLGI